MHGHCNAAVAHRRAKCLGSSASSQTNEGRIRSMAAGSGPVDPPVGQPVWHSFICDMRVIVVFLVLAPVLIAASFTAEQARTRQAHAQTHPPVVDRVVERILARIEAIQPDALAETYCHFEPTAVPMCDLKPNAGMFRFHEMECSTYGYASEDMARLHQTEGAEAAVVARLEALGYAVFGADERFPPETTRVAGSYSMAADSRNTRGFNVCWREPDSPRVAA
jgi:hypothetical protein